MGTGSFPGVKSGRGVKLTPHPHLVQRSRKKSRAIPLLSLRAFMAYDRVKPTYKIHNYKMHNTQQNKKCYIRTHYWNIIIHDMNTLCSDVVCSTTKLSNL
jgi:hypothetical protein